MDAADQLNANPLPLARLLGVEIVEVAPRRVVARLTVRPEICTSAGSCTAAPSWRWRTRPAPSAQP